MKKIICILFTLLLPFSLFGQEETLVSGGMEYGGYGGPVWKIGLVNGKAGIFSGGRGGWIIDHTLALGGGGYSLILNVDSDMKSAGGKDLFLDMSYGGFEAEYIHNSDKLLHWTIHLFLGGGKARLKEENPDKEVDSDNFFMIEPAFNLDLNVASWFRVSFGAGYRFTMGFDLEDLSSQELSGPTGVLILKFGRF